jgi:hypothetical protein
MAAFVSKTLSPASLCGIRAVKGSLFSRRIASLRTPALFSRLSGGQSFLKSWTIAMNAPKKAMLSSKPNLRPDIEKIVKVAVRDSSKQQPGVKTTFLQRFLGPKEMPERNTAAWYREMLLICTVFGITGTSTMMLVSLSIFSNGILCTELIPRFVACKTTGSTRRQRYVAY